MTSLTVFNNIRLRTYPQSQTRARLRNHGLTFVVALAVGIINGGKYPYSRIVNRKETIVTLAELWTLGGIMNVFLGLSLSLVIGCSTGQRFHQTVTEARTVPLTITRDGLVVVEVLVADRIRGRFILDTGAGLHVVSNSLLRKVSSSPAGHFTGFRHNGERVDFDTFQLESLTIADCRQEHPIVGTWSLLDSFKIDGILSLKFFEKQPFTLNFRDSLLILESQESLAGRTINRDRSTLKVLDDREKSLELFADVLLADSLMLQCEIDTGSPTSILDSRYLTVLSIDSTSSDVRKRDRPSLFGATEREYITPVPSISLRSIPESRRASLRAIFKRSLIYDGLIGMDFFVGRLATVDIANRLLYVKANGR